MSILITGGFGFIGRNLIRQLNSSEIIVLDNLDAQVHGDCMSNFPKYAQSQGNVKFYFGDICDYALLKKIFNDNGIECVVHLASSVGVGQSMYKVFDYSMVNDIGTATLWQVISDIKPISLKKFIVASSMSVYGEGPTLYEEPIGAIEVGKLNPTSVYAVQKLNQERISIVMGEALKIKTYALRLFNVYGPFQSLNNPYTGVLAIFGSAIINNEKVIIYEDGSQSRDFIHVQDICRAFKYIINGDINDPGIYNVGTGIGTSILDVFYMMREYLGKPELQPNIAFKHRKGDIRHCFAHMEKMKNVSYRTFHNIKNGLKEYCDWLLQQESENNQSKAHNELLENNLLE